MTTPTRLMPQVLKATAADFEKDAALMEAHTDQVEQDQREDGSFHTSNHLRAALYAAAHQARRAADEYCKAAIYAEALVTMQAAPVCPAEFQIFDAATLEKAEGLYVWRGAAPDPIPGQGERVQVKMNGLGPGKVAGYFLAGEAGKADPQHPERRFLGVAVLLETPPGWYKAQCPNWQTEPARVFGPEVAPLD